MAMTKQEFINYIGPIIAKDSAQWNLLPSPRIAQAVLESQYGNSQLAVEAKNLFGLKDNNQWGGRVYNKATGEYYAGIGYTTVSAYFQAYDTWEESVYWQGWYLKNRKFSASSKTTVYGALQGVRDYKQFCKLLKDCGYATSPTYTENLIRLIEECDLTRYDVLDDADIPTASEAPVGKLALTVGHSKLKSGAYTSADGRPFGGVLEYAYNKELAPLVKKWMEKANWICDMIVCPEGQFSASKEESTYKLNIVNDASRGYDLICELHLNASAAHNATGEEVLYISDSGKKYAQAVSASLSKLIKKHGSGIVYRNNLYMLTKTKPVSIMIETFFCDNSSDCAIMADKDKVAKLIAEGIVGHEIKESDVPTVKPEPTPEPAPAPAPEVPKEPDVTDKNDAEPTPEPEKPATETPTIKWWIQVGAFGVEKNAKNRVEALKKVGVNSFIKMVDGLHVVQAGAFSTREAADAHKAHIESLGFTTILREKK